MPSGSSWPWTARKLVPSGSGLDTVDCPTAESCVALVGNVASVRLDGVTWSEPVPAERIARQLKPFALSCLSASLCFTFDGLGRVLTYDGQRWSRPVQVDPSSPDDSISAISCASPNFCAIVDSVGDASFYDGKRWSKLVPVDDSGGLAALSCPAVELCFAVDSQNNEVYRFSNGHWSISAELNLSTPQGGSEQNTLNAISCGDRNFCVALDDFGDAFTYDGKWLTSPHTFDNIQLGNDALSCTAALRCVIVDDSNDVVIDDDNAWSAPEHLDASSATLVDVSCAPRTRCVAIDGGGGYFIGKKAAGS